MTNRFRSIMIEGEYLRQTSKAILIQHGAEEIWIPISQIREMSPPLDSLAGDGSGEEVEVEIPIWLAEEKGFYESDDLLD